MKLFLEVRTKTHGDSSLRLVQFSLSLFFVMEFLLKFFSWPNKLKFIFSVGNIVDVLVKFPSMIIHFTKNWLFSGSFFVKWYGYCVYFV